MLRFDEKLATALDRLRDALTSGDPGRHLTRAQDVALWVHAHLGLSSLDDSWKLIYEDDGKGGQYLTGVQWVTDGMVVTLKLDESEPVPD